MLKMIIADDEPIILKGLKKILPWSKWNMDIIGEASNGREALEQILEHNPDLLISDIAMPYMSGIELIKTIKEKRLKTKVIFISGYEDFAYARDAIRYGAIDYILKPIKQTILEEAVNKAVDDIKEQTRLSVYESESELDKVRMIFNKLEDGYEYETQELYDRFKELHIEIHDKSFVGVSIGIYKELAEESGSKYELLRLAVFSRIQELLQEKNLGFILNKDHKICNMMLISPTNCQRDSYKQEILKMKEEIKHSFQMEILIGIGACIDHIQALRHAYKTAVFALDLYFFTEETVIDYDDIQKEFNSSFDDYNQSFKKIVKAILIKNNLVQTEFTQCLSIIGDLHFGNRSAVYNRCTILITDLIKELEQYGFKDKTIEKKQKYLLDHLSEIKSFQAVKKIMTDFFNELLEIIYTDKKNRETFEVIELKNYIKNHYMDNLTLEEMAKIACMNHYYFSAFFKKATGQNFKNYLTEIRMNEAFKLAFNTDLKTYEIAHRVGYNNIRQFTDKFKEHFGKSPMDLKKER